MYVTGRYSGAGMGALGCAGRPGCGCSTGVSGLTMDGSGLFGSGLFADPFDFSTWGVGEVAALLIGGYVLYSVVSTTGRTASGVRKSVRRSSSKRRRKQQLQQELAGL